MNSCIVDEPAGEAIQAQGAVTESDPTSIDAPAAPAGSTTLYYVTDHLGTVRAVVNDQGTLVERHDYTPFGVEIPPSTNMAENTHQYTGQERDETTGMDYMHFRYYGSNLGRFMKPDNVMGNAMNPQDWNLYSYVHGNPVNFNDPTGHEANYAYEQHWNVDVGEEMGLGGGGGTDINSYTLSQFRSMFNTTALTPKQVRQFNAALNDLYGTELGRAELAAAYGAHVPIIIKDNGVTNVHQQGAPGGTTVPSGTNGRITSFEISLNFTQAGSGYLMPGTANPAAWKVHFVQFGGIKVKRQLAEILGHEMRHVVYDLENPGKALRFQDLIGMGALSMPSSDPRRREYDALKYEFEHDAYEYELFLNLQLR